MRHTVLKNIPALIMGGAIMISAGLWSTETSALPIVTVIEDCGSCLGGVYTVTQYDLVNNGATETLRIKLVADTSGFTNGSDRWVNAVGIKYYADTPLSASLIAAPIEGPWVLGLGKMGGALGACDDDATGAVSACTTSLSNIVGPVYTWIFDIVVLTGIPIIDDPSFQLRYYKPDWKNPLVGQPNGIVSEMVKAPEPGTLAIFGLGLVGLGMIRRRRVTA